MSRIRHTGIYVKDLEAMISFYKDLLGLRTAVRQRETGSYTDTIFNTKDVDIEVCKLSFEEGAMLELIRYKGETSEPDLAGSLHGCGTMHIAVTVDNAREMHEKLKGKGCKTLSQPCISPDGRACVFFARDPEGNWLELVEEL